MKRIKQINESKQMILDGFMRLLEYEKYDQITVSQIAQESGVTRMTLYRHFKEKEDIIIFAFEQNLDKALKHLDQVDNPSLQTLLEYRFKLLKESKYTSILAKQNKLNKLSQTLGKQFIHHFDSIIPEFREEYDKAFVAGGIDAMTVLWINNGMIESPEYMALKVLRVFDLFS